MSTELTFEIRNNYENMFRRQMLSILSAVETKAMVYILDRTLGWMTDREYLSYREFKEGGRGQSLGAGIEAKTAMRCVRALVAKGIISVLETTKKHGTLILVNLAWSIESMLREPKQAKKPAKTEKLSTSSVVRGTTPCGTGDYTGVVSRTTPLERNIKNYTERTTSANRAGLDSEENLKPVAKTALSVSEAIDAGKAKNVAAAAAKRGKMSSAARSGRVTGEAMEQFWVDGIRDKNPRAAFKVWTGKERGQSKHITNLTSVPAGKILDFVYFCANEWEVIIRSQFAWASSELSSEPNIGFVLKYLNQFAGAYNNRDKLKQRESLSMVERRIARLKDSGYTDEEARAEVSGAIDRNANKRHRERPAKQAAKPVDYLKQYHQGKRPERKPEPVVDDKPVADDKPVRVREIEDIGVDFGELHLKAWEEIHGD